MYVITVKIRTHWPHDYLERIREVFKELAAREIIFESIEKEVS